MNYIKFGKTRERIFITGIGTYGHGGAYGRITKRESRDALIKSLEWFSDKASVLIDTAPRYGEGHCESVIGETIKELPERKVLLATKGGRHIEPDRLNEKDFSSEFLRTDLEGSLERLGADKIFLYQLHNPSLEIIKEGKVFDLLEDLRREGKVKYYGVSINSAEEGIASMRVCQNKGYEGLASLQTIYNILDKRVSPEFLAMAKKQGVSIIAREPMLRGLLTGKFEEYLSDPTPAVQKLIRIYSKEQLWQKIKEVRQINREFGVESSFAQVALKFVLSEPGISVVIPGINKPEFIAPDLSAEKTELSGELLESLRSLSDLERV